MTSKEPEVYSNPRGWQIDQGWPPPIVWEVILQYHIRPLVTHYHSTGIALVPSRGSCYRPVAWEQIKGRSGMSLHTFRVGTRGAIDLVRSDGVDVATELDWLIEESPYRRICFYPLERFIHADYGDHDGQLCDRRQLYEAPNRQGDWKFRSWLPETRL